MITVTARPGPGCVDPIRARIRCSTWSAYSPVDQRAAKISANSCSGLRRILGMSRRLAEVAKKVGVSEATVSRVLNEKPGVSDATRQAVLTALDVLGYERPSKLRGERARLVGLFLPELTNPIFPAFGELVGAGLAQHGYTPVLCTMTVGRHQRGRLRRAAARAARLRGGLRRRPVHPGGRVARPLRPALRARPADGSRERADRRPALPDGVHGRLGRDRTGLEPPGAARAPPDRAGPRTGRSHPVPPQAGGGAPHRGGDGDPAVR